MNAAGHWNYISFSEYIEIIAPPPLPLPPPSPPPSPSVIAEANKLDPEIQNFSSFGIMQN